MSQQTDMVLVTGIYKAVSRTRYDSIKERVNFSTLKEMKKCPRKYKHAVEVRGKKDTDAMKLGRVVHVAVFEPERFKDSVAVWEEGPRKGPEWKAFQDRNRDRELLTLKEHTTCMVMQDVMRNEPRLAKYLDGNPTEVTMLWDSPLPIPPDQLPVSMPSKGRIDCNARNAIIDLKTTKDCEPAVFGRQAYDLRYRVQAAWYLDGYVLAGGDPKPYKIITVENVEPYIVEIYNPTRDQIFAGRNEYLTWLMKLQECRATNTWPGYSMNGEEMDLEEPPWADRDSEDEDLDDVELTSGGEPFTGERD